MFSGLGGHSHGLLGIGMSQQDYLNQMAMSQQAAAQQSAYWAAASQGAMLQNAAAGNHNPDERLLVLLTDE